MNLREHMAVAPIDQTASGQAWGIPNQKNRVDVQTSRQQRSEKRGVFISPSGVRCVWLEDYNHDRTHQGKMCRGRTPMEWLKMAIKSCKRRKWPDLERTDTFSKPASVGFNLNYYNLGHQDS